MKDYPLIRVVIVFIGGIIFQKVFPLGINIIIFLLASGLSLSVLKLTVKKSSDTKKPELLLPFLLVFTTGTLAYSMADKSVKHYPFDSEKIKNAVISGRIDAVELKRDYEIRFTLEADLLLVSGKTLKVNHRFLTRLRYESRAKLDSAEALIHPGRYIRLSGSLSKGRGIRNPGEFDYQKYLEQNGISGLFTSYDRDSLVITEDKTDLFAGFILEVRRQIDKKLFLLFDPNTASLLRGLLLADRSRISEDVQEDFTNTGVVHILAVSGSNVAFIAFLLLFIFGRANHYLRTFIVFSGLIFYLLITGLNPPVVRATIMASVMLIAYLTGRSFNIYNSLAISSLVILTANPLQLFDVGFQLSFASVLGIAAVYPWFSGRIKKLKLYRFINTILLYASVTISAQLLTMPFTLYYFQKISLISIAANLIIIPLISLITAAGMCALVVSVVWLQGALVYSAAADFFTAICYSAASFLASVSYAYLDIFGFSVYDSIIYFLTLSLFSAVIIKFKGALRKFVYICLIIADFLLLTTLDNRKFLPDNCLSILAIDVGQGDASLIRFPDGTCALIDAGEANRFFDTGEMVIFPLMKYLGIEKIDMAFLSHIDSDHYGGFVYLLRQGVIKKLFKPLADSSEKKDLKFEKFLHQTNTPIEYYDKKLLRRNNLRIYIPVGYRDYSTELKGNDRSGIIKICYGRTSFLFTGDAQKKEETLLVNKFARFLKSDFLKVSHHGSRGSSSQEFLNYVKPGIALISSGVQNRFGHPSKLVLERLQLTGTNILRTDKKGAVLLISDGSTITEKSWR